MAGDAVAQDALLWGPLPSIQDCERALEFTAWEYMGGDGRKLYREKYGDEPNFAVDEPDGGLLVALSFLKRAVALLPGRHEVVEDWHGKCKTTVCTVRGVQVPPVGARCAPRRLHRREGLMKAGVARYTRGLLEQAADCEGAIPAFRWVSGWIREGSK